MQTERAALLLNVYSRMAYINEFCELKLIDTSTVSCLLPKIACKPQCEDITMFIQRNIFCARVSVYVVCIYQRANGVAFSVTMCFFGSPTILRVSVPVCFAYICEYLALGSRYVYICQYLLLARLFLLCLCVTACAWSSFFICVRVHVYVGLLGWFKGTRIYRSWTQAACCSSSNPTLLLHPSPTIPRSPLSLSVPPLVPLAEPPAGAGAAAAPALHGPHRGG
jgi:hypothetical protein